MLRQAITRSSRSAVRTFHQSTRAMAAGDVGGVRASGQQDSFSKREKANEDFEIRKREKEKLLELKKKLADSKKDIETMESQIAKMSEEDKK